MIEPGQRNGHADVVLHSRADGGRNTNKRRHLYYTLNYTKDNTPSRYAGNAFTGSSCLREKRFCRQTPRPLGRWLNSA